jgi:hypothetical protein
MGQIFFVLYAVSDTCEMPPLQQQESIRDVKPLSPTASVRGSASQPNGSSGQSPGQVRTSAAAGTPVTAVAFKKQCKVLKNDGAKLFEFLR